jgi:hypothetical protein
MWYAEEFFPKVSEENTFVKIFFVISSFYRLSIFLGSWTNSSSQK